MGGLAVGAILFDVVFSSLNFLRAGTTGLVAQAFGADDTVEQTAVVLRALMLAVLLGFAALMLADPILTAGLYFIAPESDVAAAVALYFGIRILAAPLTLANYVVLGWALGVARAGLGLGLQVVLNGTNIALSLWLGLSLGWGIEGVAWATLIAEGVALIAGSRNIGAFSPWNDAVVGAGSRGCGLRAAVRVEPRHPHPLVLSAPAPFSPSPR